MKETEKLGLRLPEDNDTADIAALNGNFEALDTAMAGKADLDGTGKVPVEQLPNVAPTAHAGSHAAGGADPVTPGSIGAATALTLSCTVPVSWTASGGYYCQQVSVPGMLETDNPIADYLPGGDHGANKLYAEAWNKVQSIDTLNGAVNIWCTAAPGTAFPVQFKIVR